MILENILLTLQPFVVDLNGIGTGEKSFSAVVDEKFFESFENTDILDADLAVECKLRNRGASVDVNCRIKGTVTVSCDLCLEPLALEVETGFEETYTPQGSELDLSQDIYDYVITSLPLRRVHPDGECNEETIKYLSK